MGGGNDEEVREVEEEVLDTEFEVEEVEGEVEDDLVEVWGKRASSISVDMSMFLFSQ